MNKQLYEMHEFFNKHDRVPKEFFIASNNDHSWYVYVGFCSCGAWMHANHSFKVDDIPTDIGKCDWVYRNDKTLSQFWIPSIVTKMMQPPFKDLWLDLPYNCEPDSFNATNRIKLIKKYEREAIQNARILRQT